MSLHPGSSPFLEVWLMETKPYKPSRRMDGRAACALIYADSAVAVFTARPETPFDFAQGERLGALFAQMQSSLSY